MGIVHFKLMQHEDQPHASRCIKFISEGKLSSTLRSKRQDNYPGRGCHYVNTSMGMASSLLTSAVDPIYDEPDITLSLSAIIIYVVLACIPRRLGQNV